MTLAFPLTAVVPADEHLGGTTAVVLPSGRVLDLRRSRWDGVLDAEEVAFCRTNGIPLGYDPAQIGWVLLESTRSAEPSRHAKVTVARSIGFRRWTDADVREHRALLGDPAVWEHLPESYPDPFTDATSRDLIALANADIGHDVVAVELDGELIGQCLIRFDQLSSRPATAEVAYWLGREHWGRGVMSRVLPAFVDRCFDRHPVEQLYAWIRPANVASVRVAEGAGLRRMPDPDEARLAASQDRAGFLRWTIGRPV